MACPHNKVCVTACIHMHVICGQAKLHAGDMHVCIQINAVMTDITRCCKHLCIVIIAMLTLIWENITTIMKVNITTQFVVVLHSRCAPYTV